MTESTENDAWYEGNFKYYFLLARDSNVDLFSEFLGITCAIQAFI